jgi:predicted nucleic acid-binding protein
LGDPRVSFAEEPPNLEKHWRGFTQVQRFSPHVWNDAYLAGFAIASNLELVSFDKGFLQDANLTCVIL